MRRTVVSIVIATLAGSFGAGCSVSAPSLPVEPGGRVPTRIVYSANREFPNFQIYSMKLDGTDDRRLSTDTSRAHSWPRPSPDGSRVLFYKADPGETVNEFDTNELWVYNAADHTERLLIPRGAYGWTHQGHAEWSPDGTKLVMVAGSTEFHLWVTDADGSHPVQLTDRRNSFGGALATIDPSWGPDGSTIMFTGCPPERGFCLPWDYEVYRLDLTTGQETRLTFDTTADFDPYLTPDGSTYVWLKCSGGFPFGPWGLYHASAATPVPTPLIDDGETNANATMLHDSRGIVFSRQTSSMVPGQRIFTMGFGDLVPTLVKAAPLETDLSIFDEISPAYW